MPRFSDKAFAIRDVEDLALHEAVLELLYDSSGNDSDSDDSEHYTKEDSVIMDLDDIAQMHDTLFANRYLAIRSPIQKDTQHYMILFGGGNKRQFQTLFRMERSTFDQLLEAIQGDPVFENKSPGRNQIDCKVQLGIFLYRCGDPGSGVRIASHFGVSESTIFLCIKRVILALLRLWKSYIQWPKPGSAEYKRLRGAIADRSPYFEGCVGFVDGSEIILRDKLLLDGESFFSRKSNYSINLQAVCDHESRFNYISCGYPQAAGDVNAWKHTRMYNHPNDVRAASLMRSR
jgi:hypothetical protein